MYRFHLERCCAWQGLSASTHAHVNFAAALQKLLSYSSGFSPGSRAASFVRHSVQSDGAGAVWSCSHCSVLHWLFQEMLSALICCRSATWSKAVLLECRVRGAEENTERTRWTNWWVFWLNAIYMVQATAYLHVLAHCSAVKLSSDVNSLPFSCQCVSLEEKQSIALLNENSM